MTPKLPSSALEDIGFDTLFDAAPAPCLVLSPQLSILAANAAYLAVAGRDRASIVGLNIFEAFPDNPDHPHADGVASLRASLQRVLATGRPDRMAAMRYDVAPEPGGTNFLPRYWRSVNTPVLADDCAVRCIIESVEEVPSAFLTRRRQRPCVRAAPAPSSMCRWSNMAPWSPCCSSTTRLRATGRWRNCC